jgi:hypothetical protein
MGLELAKKLSPLTANPSSYPSTHQMRDFLNGTRSYPGGEDATATMSEDEPDTEITTARYEDIGTSGKRLRADDNVEEAGPFLRGSIATCHALGCCSAAFQSGTEFCSIAELPLWRSGASDGAKEAQ